MAESGTDLDPGNWSWNGNWNLYCWVGSMGSDSSWIRELELILLSRIDGIGLVLDPGTGTYTAESDRWDRTRLGSGNWNLTGTWQELDLDWNLTLTGTGPWLELELVSRIDGIGLVLDPGTRTWLELDWNWTLTGTGTRTGTVKVERVQNNTPWESTTSQPKLLNGWACFYTRQAPEFTWAPD